VIKTPYQIHFRQIYHYLPILPLYHNVSNKYYNDMFSKDPKYSKIQIFRTSAQNLAGGAYSGPPEPLAGGVGRGAPPQELHPLSRASLFGSRGRAYCRVGNPTHST